MIHYVYYSVHQLIELDPEATVGRARPASYPGIETPGGGGATQFFVKTHFEGIQYVKIPIMNGLPSMYP